MIVAVAPPVLPSSCTKSLPRHPAPRKNSRVNSQKVGVPPYLATLDSLSLWPRCSVCVSGQPMEIAFDTAPPRRVRSASMPGISTGSLLNRIERPSLAERLASGQNSKQPTTYVPLSPVKRRVLTCFHIARVPFARDHLGLQEVLSPRGQRLGDRRVQRPKQQKSWTESWTFSWQMTARTPRLIPSPGSWNPLWRRRM